MPIKPEIGEMGFGKIIGSSTQSNNRNQNDKYNNQDDNQDDRLIVQLQAQMDKLVDKVQEQILLELKNPKAHGTIPFNDNTNTSLILNHFGVSKKVFKRAIGGLLKQGKIKQTAKGIVRM